MAETVLMIDDESSYYLKKIEILANARLAFFRKQELREETKESTDMVNGEDDNKKKRKGPKVVRTGESDNKKKRRKVPKVAVRTAVVSNDITDRLKEFVVNELKGTELTLVIQKMLYKSDTKRVLNRLNMPIKQLETDEFLTADEKRILSRSGQEEGDIEVRLLGPTLEMYDKPIKLRMWRMESTSNYVLTTNWYKFRSMNKLLLKINSSIQVWSFRGSNRQLCFAVVCVEDPDVEVDDSDS